MSIIEKLQKVNSDYNHVSQIRNQARSLALLSSGIYTEAERFVYELLQNAIDAFVDVDFDRLDIRISLIGDYFVFMHNGAAFSDSDIEGLCSVGNGNKSKNSKKVGYKGIGFKAVFIQSSLVYVQSGKTCCFKFDKEACFNLLPENLKAELKRDNVPLYDDVPWQIIPIESNPPVKLDAEGFNVVIYIKMSRLAELLPKIKKLLTDKEFLLFLNAKQVSVSLFDNNRQITSISRAKKGEVVELAVNGTVQSRWMMHSESVAVTGKVREYISQNVSSVPEKLRDANQIEVTFSVKVGDDGKFVPLENSVVYTYLPTSYGGLGVPYLINANFLTDAGRQQLQKDSEWNKLIFREAPRLFLKWVSTISHKHPEYYKILPKRFRFHDELSGIFFNSLSEAIKDIAFLPSVRVSGKTVLVSDAYIDRIGLSKVFGVEKFLSCVNKCFNRNYDEDGEVADVDSAILSEYGVKIFATREVLQLLRDGRILTDITADENFKLVEFLRKHITSREEIEDLGPVAFLLDDTNRLCVARNLCLPSEFKSQNAPAKDVRTLNERLYETLKDKEELLWLRDNFGIKEMSNFGFVEYILEHPDDYVTIDNAILLGRFLFRVWKKENFLDRSDVAEKFKRVLFLTNTGELKPIVNLYLGSKYQPKHDIEKVAPDRGMFISPKYPEDNDCLEDWSFFLKKCGASDSVGITQRILNAERITDERKEAEELKAYPILEEAAVAFYSKRHEKSNYYNFRNPIIPKQIAVSYFTCVDPSKRGAGELERYVLNIGLSQQFQREAIEDKISGKVDYWGTSKEDSLFNLVASKYKTFIEYALAEKQLFPTVMGTSLPAKDVFINNSKITRLAGQYLPVLDISNTVHDSWRKILPFKETLTLDDYLMLLANIANDTEHAKNNRERVSSIYESLIVEGYYTNEEVGEWGKTYKILSKNNEYMFPSDLSYITIAGFGSVCQAYGKVDRHLQYQLIDLFRTLGVRIVDKVSPEFLPPCPKESIGLKDNLSCKIAYIAMIRSHHRKSDYDECVKEVEKLIDCCSFYQCERIDLSYGDDEDRISKVAYAEGTKFYYVGELGPTKMELLTKSLCKYFGLGDKDGELLIVLISNTYNELDEYFKEKGYADELLNKVKKVVAAQSEVKGKDSAEASTCLESGVGQTLESDDNVAPDESEKRSYKIGEYEVGEDEYSQLSQIFAGGVTSDDADAEKKQDESKLACLRLFNYLRRLELEPSMDGHTDSQYIVKNLYAKFKKLGPNLDLKDGRTIHVISAMGGIAYLPPYWWDKVVKDPRAEICAVAGAREEDFCFIRNRDDLLEKIGDNAVPVKIRGRNHEERASLVESWFGRVQTSETATKIYALLKVKVKTRMDGAFEKGICNDEMGQEEEENGYDEYF